MTPRPVRKSLAKAFQPAAMGPDRAESLTGLLPPRPAGDRPPDPPAVPPEGSLALVPDPSGEREPVSQRQGGAAGSARKSKRAETTAPEFDLALVRNVAVYLPLDLLERLRRTSRSRELAYADLVVEASEAHLAEMAAHFPAAGERDITKTGMPTRPARQRSVPGVQVQIRLDGHQVAWLDQQVERFGAPSRSALVAALLRAHLGKSP